MRDILAEIVEKKKEIVRDAKKQLPIGEIMENISYASFEGSHSLKKHGWSLIAECKLQSPAKGRLTRSHSVLELAKTYEKNGATMLSVHTDPHFLGKNGDFIEVRKSVKLPLLRKDFIIDPYQIYESRYLGADAVLLIVRILTPQLLKSFLYLTWSLGMDALLEVHDEKDLDTALRTPAHIIGINNRNLVTFETSIAETLKLMPKMDKTRIIISESGVFTADDVRTLKAAQCDGILVGEGLVRAEDVAKQTRLFAGDAFKG